MLHFTSTLATADGGMFGQRNPHYYRRAATANESASELTPGGARELNQLTEHTQVRFKLLKNYPSVGVFHVAIFRC